MQKMDDYLDGALSAPDRLEVDALVAGDAEAARTLAAAKAQRALRAAAYESYAPTADESASLAGHILDACHNAPVGRIEFSYRRYAGIAAALLIMAGIFFAGRFTAPTQIVNVPGPTNIVYNVVYTENGATMLSEFNTKEERDGFVAELETRGATGIAVADLTTFGHM